MGTMFLLGVLLSIPAAFRWKSYNEVKTNLNFVIAMAMTIAAFILMGIPAFVKTHP